MYLFIHYSLFFYHSSIDLFVHSLLYHLTCFLYYQFRSNADNFPRDDSGSVLFDDVDYKETWRCLEQCVDQGLIRAIGLSNFNSKQVQDVMDNCRIKPANLQV